jgi:hypothetical protein
VRVTPKSLRALQLPMPAESVAEILGNPYFWESFLAWTRLWLCAVPMGWLAGTLIALYRQAGGRSR